MTPSIAAQIEAVRRAIETRDHQSEQFEGARYDAEALRAVLATLQQHERAMKALRDIAEGNGVPDSMLESGETFRKQFAPFLQAKARDALAALDADETSKSPLR